MDNIDFFNITALEVFHLCLKEFPSSTGIDTTEVRNTVTGYFSDIELEGTVKLTSRQLDDRIFDSIDWLISEGFLVDKGSSDSGYVVGLTQKGLNTLNKSPTSINNSKSFRQVFNDGLMSISKSVASGIMVEFFKSGS
jgi:hypothetical protein